MTIVAMKGTCADVALPIQDMALVATYQNHRPSCTCPSGYYIRMYCAHVYLSVTMPCTVEGSAAAAHVRL